MTMLGSSTIGLAYVVLVDHPKEPGYIAQGGFPYKQELSQAVLYKDLKTARKARDREQQYWPAYVLTVDLTAREEPDDG